MRYFLHPNGTIERTPVSKRDFRDAWMGAIRTESNRGYHRIEDRDLYETTKTKGSKESTRGVG